MSITDEWEQLFSSFKAKTYDYITISEEPELYKIEKEKLKSEVYAFN